MSTVTHEGHEYQPAAEVQPQEGDRVAMLDRWSESRHWFTVEGPVERVGDSLFLGNYELHNEYGWSLRPVRIVQRAQPAEPTGIGAVVRADGVVWVRNAHQDRNTPVPWRRVNSGARWEDWAFLCELGPVEVLSDGWTEEP